MLTSIVANDFANVDLRVGPGDTITIDLGEGEVEVTVPDGVGPGGEFDVAVG